MDVCSINPIVNVSERDANINFIGQKELHQMKKGAFLINASFGDAVSIASNHNAKIDIDALIMALESKHLAGAALDVFPERFFNDPSTSGLGRLSELSNVLLTPKIGAKTEQATERIGVEVANVLARYISDGIFPELISVGSTASSVNLPNVIAWPLKTGSRRIINIHRNVRGFMKEISSLLSNYNVGKQVLETNSGYGYLIVDITADNVTNEIVTQLALLSNTVRTRIL